jgi:hypothetical protein
MCEMRHQFYSIPVIAIMDEGSQAIKDEVTLQIEWRGAFSEVLLLIILVDLPGQVGRIDTPIAVTRNIERISL